MIRAQKHRGMLTLLFIVTLLLKQLIIELCLFNFLNGHYFLFQITGAGSTPLHYAASGGNVKCCQASSLYVLCWYQNKH